MLWACNFKFEKLSLLFKQICKIFVRLISIKALEEAFKVTTILNVIKLKN